MASWTPEHLAPATLPNTESPWATIAEEQREREAAAEAHLQAIRCWNGALDIRWDAMVSSSWN
jgi:hypothetical protein